jgi:hypothetical protein
MNIADGWRDIHERAVRLCETIAQLPDECPCGDPDAHLEGRCPCCGGHSQQHIGSGHHVGCSELLTNLRADFMLFLHDFKATAGPLEVEVPDEVRPEIRRGIFLAAVDLDHVLLKLNGIDEAVVGFRRTCAVSDMKRIKRQAVSLREHFERLDRNVKGG